LGVGRKAEDLAPWKKKKILLQNPEKLKPDQI
jgi:hypothetical protein